MLNEILLRRRNKIVFDEITQMPTSESHVDRAIIMEKNIESLGYCFSKELFNVVSGLLVEEQNIFYKELVGCLKEYTGANKQYTFMYPGFPEQVEKADDWELFVNAIVHYISLGKIVPNYEEDPRLPLFEDVKLKTLSLGEKDDIDELLSNLMTSKTSLSQQDKDDMTTLLLNGFFADKLPNEIPFKENVAEICKIIIENTHEVVWNGVLRKYLKTSTDILRFIVRLSDGDTSLATPTKFKSMPRKQRRLIMCLLESCGSSLEEDMKKYQNQWIRVGEVIHPSEFKGYEKVQVAFDKLRNGGKIETFSGKVSAAIKNDDIVGAVKLLKSRPGEFARMLDMLCRKSNRVTTIVDEFSEVANKISVPVLLQVREHFTHRNEDTDSRVFFPKGQLAKSYTIANELGCIPSSYCSLIVSICEDAIIEQFEAKEPMGKVYISDNINGFCAPQSQRSASSTMKNVTRCSRFSIQDDAKFVRLGIHWMNELTSRGDEERTDIDLSCSFLDKDFSNMDHVSYTHLKNNYCTHSGDLTNAPRDKGGSAECVDINIEKALQSGVKYAVVQVYGYTNHKFSELDDMLFNWQEGVNPIEGDIFEPSRVQQSMNLAGETSCEIPVVFDLENREVIWFDMTLNTQVNFPRCVEGNIKGVAATVMGIVQSHKPQMSDLALLNALARGSIVYDRNEADVIFDLDETKPMITTEKTVEVQNEKGEVLEVKTVKETKEKDCKIITPWMVDYWMSDLL